ncbi:MAG: molybdate ABC transporter substrate-binding protein [Nitrospirae bacterium]|nr:molybdate ABC transporter substrate-binding protein [Nitrospirota bacterium]
MAVGMFALLPAAAMAATDELNIAAASDLNFAFKELVGAFERQTGTHVKLSMGSSGNFFAQIQNGAPYDLYFSADIRYPQQLMEKGHAQPGSLYRYAVGRIVLWVSTRMPADLGKGMEVLLDPAVRKVAIANPKHAPYGRAAVAAMEHFKIYERAKDKLVYGENIAQAAQFVQSGAADAGIIALSLALAPTMKEQGRFWEVPRDAYPALEQGAVIVKGASNQVAAHAFLSFLQSPAGQDVMQRYGFAVPPSGAAQ